MPATARASPHDGPLLVGAGHSHLGVHGHSVVHRLPAQVKIVALVAFVFTVVLTPREEFWAFAVYAVLLAVVAAIAGLPPRLVLRRMVVEVPFLVFALLLPFVSQGPQVEFLGMTVSESGLLAAWNLLAKGTLGVVAAIILAATTPSRDLLVGLQRLHLPPLLVEIATFMVRYLEVVGGEMRRMRIARESRGFHASNLGHLRVVAQSAGALFIRSYERGERVHLAMLSRGYTGSLPLMDSHPATASAWATAAVLPFAALMTASAAWIAS